MGPVTLKYGKTGFLLPLKNKEFVILRPSKIIPVSHPEQYLESVIDDPVGGLPLGKNFLTEDRVLIIVSDITRYTGAELFLPVLLQRLNRTGICDDQISVLFSLGIHRKLTAREKKIIVGEDVARRIKLFQHDPDDRGQMEYVGETSRGTPILINQKVLETDRLILTGGIAFHYLAGFGGAGKALLPGVSSRESCLAFHKLILKSQDYGIRTQSFAGQLEDNLMQEDILEVADKLSPDFILNTITSSSGKIIYAVAGELKAAHKKGCNHFLEHYGVQIKEKADLVIVSCGGYPKDINFIQAHKSIEHAFQAVREGGVMIVLAECPDGFGNPTFLNWFQNRDKKSFLENLNFKFEINGQTAFATFMKAKMVRIILVSSLKTEDVAKMSLIPAANIDKALDLSQELLGKNPTTFVIPEGASVLPISGNFKIKKEGGKEEKIV